MFATLSKEHSFEDTSLLLLTTHSTSACAQDVLNIPPPPKVFGPLLSVIAVDSLDDAIGFLRGRDAPLVLYIFTNDTVAADRIIANTLSGGVLVNDCLMHLSNPNLPFGGVGASGFGSYKGKWGFEEFSHR
jgi:acyl-CoA reductase-like NAD-dependent aldehyde dehydrogenase